jgi:hypothetical protein
MAHVHAAHPSCRPSLDSCRAAPSDTGWTRRRRPGRLRSGGPTASCSGRTLVRARLLPEREATPATPPTSIVKVMNAQLPPESHYRLRLDAGHVQCFSLSNTSRGVSAANRAGRSPPRSRRPGCERCLPPPPSLAPPGDRDHALLRQTSRQLARTVAKPARWTATPLASRVT